MYNCYFPHCKFSTTFRHLIDAHHIIPKELNSKSKLTLYFCKTHHAFIYHPEAKHGQHAIKTSESIEILNLLNSTEGKALHYKDSTGKTFYYFYRTGEIVAD
jgi:hypothetical protein